MSELKLPVTRHPTVHSDVPGYDIKDTDGRTIARVSDQGCADAMVRSINSHAALVDVLEACRHLLKLGVRSDNGAPLWVVDGSDFDKAVIAIRHAVSEARLPGPSMATPPTEAAKAETPNETQETDT